MMASQFRQCRRFRHPLALFVLVVGTSGVGCSHKEEMPSNRDPYNVPVTNGRIKVSADNWRKIEDPEPYAKNFEAIRPGKGQAYHIVTIVLIPMSPDRKLGEKLSRNEYLDILWHEAEQTGQIWIRIRVDRGSYWLLSNQKFEVPEVLKHGLMAESRGASTEGVFALFRTGFQNEIDRTRYILATEFQAHP